MHGQQHIKKTKLCFDLLIYFAEKMLKTRDRAILRQTTNCRSALPLVSGDIKLLVKRLPDHQVFDAG